MNRLIKPRSKYHLKLIDQIHDENINEGIKNREICQLTKTLFSKHIKEITISDNLLTELGEMLDLFTLKTIYNSIVDVRPVQNFCNPNTITQREKGKNDNGDIGLVIPENQYAVLEYNYAISNIPNPVELVLRGNFDTKDRCICTNIQQRPAN